MIGGPSEWLTPKIDGWRWFISRHEPPGWGGQVIIGVSGHTVQTTALGPRYTYQEDRVSGNAVYFSRDGLDYGSLAFDTGFYSAEASHSTTYIDVTQYDYTDYYGPSPRNCSYLNRYTSTSVTPMGYSTNNYFGAIYSSGVLNFFPLLVTGSGQEVISFVVIDSCYPNTNVNSVETRDTYSVFLPSLNVLVPTDPSKPFIGSDTKTAQIDGISSTQGSAWSFADLLCRSPAAKPKPQP
jgi:hypothetical protein